MYAKMDTIKTIETILGVFFIPGMSHSLVTPDQDW